MRHLTPYAVARLAMASGAMLAVACGGAPEPVVPDELPEASVTSWTEATELFMEHPPLIAGEIVRFAVHLTVLADFSALNAGRPSIELRRTGGVVASVPGSEPLRPGAFRVEGPMPAAGEYAWVLVVSAPGLSDRHELGTVTVYPDEVTARAALEPEADEPTISYLKESQWTTPFQTSIASERTLRTSVRVPARVAPVTGGEVVVAAPASGRLVADSLPPLGSPVAAGHVLAQIEPRISALEDRALLVQQLADAELAMEAARTEEQRAERLLAALAVPARRLEEARRAVAAADARLQAAQTRLARRDETLSGAGTGAGDGAFVLRAPIAGRVVAVNAIPGAAVQEGAELFRIVQTNPVMLTAWVPTGSVSLVGDVTGVEFERPGMSEPLGLSVRRARNTGTVDAETGALRLMLEVDNVRGELLIGQSGTAVLYEDRRQSSLALPRGAVLSESGQPIVFVQSGGESFEKRRVVLGPRDGGFVAVRAGLAAGERVVIVGAYEVLLASAARGLPAEGHVH